MTLYQLTTALGGIGLLLLGMSMLTDGLKAAAGSHLRGFLEHSTQTRARAATAGFMMTALIQSSGAVVVTLLGFTNAGMLRLRQAAWVVFGSNVGTTVTAWIVALVGLQFKVSLIALPLIGIGMLLRLSGGEKQRRHIGFALAGFGVLFIGLDTLQMAFAEAATWLPLDQFQTDSFQVLALAVVSGFLLTALLQSSSASLAIILSAAVSGVFSPLIGASLVIGANLGSTMMAVLASIGATAHAKRLAAVHVLMNVVTAIVALILLVPLWWSAEWLAGDQALSNMSAGLAVFHTLFNVLGLLLMRLIDAPMLNMVEHWIKVPALRTGTARYLDNTVLAVPAMGVAAMRNEQRRVLRQHMIRLRRLLHDQVDSSEQAENVATGELLQVIEEFSEKLSQQLLQGQQAEDFVELSNSLHDLRDLRHLLEELEHADNDRLKQSLNDDLRAQLLQLLHGAQLKVRLPEHTTTLIEAIETTRQAYRQELLVKINRDEIPAIQGTEAIQMLSTWGRVVALIQASQRILATPESDE